MLRRAMAYGTALASFNVEEFGTERVARLTGGRDRRARRASSARITHFSDAPIALRGAEPARPDRATGSGAARPAVPRTSG